MTQELIPYKFDDKDIRIMKNEQGEAWFVAKDICDACGDTNYHRTISRLDDDDKGVSKVSTPGGIQDMVIVNEPGMYTLLLKMQPRKNTFEERMEKVKKFQRWVTHEVLPSIRKMGFYSTSPTGALDMIIAMAQEQKKALTKLSAMETRLTSYEKKQEKISAVLSPVKEVSTRLKLSQLIREAAKKHGKDFKECWDLLYYQFKYRYSIDLNQRAKNAKKDRLDIAEELNCLEDLFALAVKLFVG